jgi:hypothetical protein
VAGYWRRLHSEELRNFDALLNIITAIVSRWAGHVEQMGRMRNVHEILIGKPERDTWLRRPRIG